jgi:hypothetical protein
MSELKDKQEDKLKQDKNKTDESKNKKSEIIEQVQEIGGPKFEPTTYGDWQVKGRCSDF